ncbi:MFS transporter [Kordiimonas marina]|uniref:MFS transporter n=1 Tax=Kordiimonas marina TaxID=2872312 RepID=UPI001FF42FB5|nr:MFS transporter [Kordiimonas marina]MCJ9427548.1 MFS transporter [Kordiimonas marina]
MTDLNGTAPPLPQRSGLPTAAPNGHVAAILLSFLTTAGLFYVNIMPALVSGLVSGMGLSRAAAGYVASANVYGAALGAFTAVFVIKRLRWKAAAVIALLCMTGVDFVSSLQTTGNILVPLRFLHGMAGGFLVGIGFSVIARTAVPDRVFGMLLVVQYGLGGVGLMTLPRLVPIYGTEVLFYALIAFSLVTLLMVPFLDAYPPKPKKLPTPDDDGNDRVVLRPLVLALLAVFCFQAANMGLAAYVIELGKNAGLGTDSISNSLGFANWIAVLGALAVYFFGLKNGRTLPLIAGFVLTLAGMAMFHLSHYGSLFFLANIITGITWAFMIPYLLGMCAAFDSHGRMATLSGFFSKLGLASGPALAALLIGSNDYDQIIAMAIIGIVLSAATAMMPARLLDRQAEPSPGQIYNKGTTDQ